jgi:glycosyltransferase involved in cell wall biosynthesis
LKLNSNKKILLLIPDYGLGGAQRVFSDQSKFLSRHFDVTLCTFNSDSVDIYDSVGNKINLNVKAGGNVFEKIYFFLLRINALRKVKKQFDLCISHLEGADYINLLSAKSVKTICCIHGTKFHDGEIRGFLGWIRKEIFMPFLYNRADLIVTVSDAIRSELILGFKIAENRIKVINNGFDIEAIEIKSKQQVPQEVNLLFDHHETICLCSRLAPQKNQKSFLNIFSHVVKSAKCKLILLGDGELRKELIDQTNKLGLKTFSIWDGQPFSDQFDVYFLGALLNPFSYMARSSLFVLPSAWEGFPLALCEAMACNVPVIAADCPTGPREILDVKEGDFESRYGVLLPIPTEIKDQNFYSWVDAILFMLSDKDKRKDLATRAKVRVADFSIHRMGDSWVKAINSIL